jgi:hypothetical protein
LRCSVTFSLKPSTARSTRNENAQVLHSSTAATADDALNAFLPKAAFASQTPFAQFKPAKRMNGQIPQGSHGNDRFVSMLAIVLGQAEQWSGFRRGTLTAPLPTPRGAIATPERTR